METIYLEYAGAADAGHFKYSKKNEDGTYENNVKYTFNEMNVDDVSYTVRGFDEASHSQIYSNDIKSFTDEEFTIKCKAGTLLEGRYNKDAVAGLGGSNGGAKLHIKLTGTHDGQPVVVFLKGNNYFNVSKLIGKGGDIDITKDMLKLNGFTDEKAGAVKYRAPVFVKGGARAEEISVEDNPF